MRTRIAWEGKGYYKRERDYQGSTENGISWVGYVWRKTWHGAYDAHLVTRPAEITRTFEPRYH